MTNEVYDLMRECVRGKGPDDYVFTRDEERGDGRVVRTGVVDPRDDWYALCVESGLGRWVTAKRKNGQDYLKYVGLNLHDFRRSAIRNMTRRGVGTKTAMRISGHKAFAVFQRYNITDEADLIQASELIENHGPKPQVKTDTRNIAHS